MYTTDLTASRLTSRSLGLVRRCELVEEGIAYSTIRARLRNGVWAEPYAGVIDVTRQSETWDRRVLAAVLSGPVGTLASHQTAAALHRFPGFKRSGRVHLLVPRTGRNVDLTNAVHSTLIPDVGTEVDDIPCTSVGRTLHLLSAAGDVRGLSRAVRHVLRGGDIDPRSLLDERLAATAGYALLERTLDDEARNTHAVDSTLEEAWVDRLLGWDLPPFVTQHPVRAEGHHYRLDVAWPDHLVCLEGDGDGFHGDLRSQDADGRRGVRVSRLGYRTKRVGSGHLEPARAERVRAHLIDLLSH